MAKVELAGIRHLLFTSINAVHAFVRLNEKRDIPALCVGTHTAKVAQAAGLVARSADGSASDLVALALSVTGPFLYPRGVHMARDIASDLRASGQRVDEVVVYDQTALPLTAQARAALTDRTPCLVPLFSPRTARLFMAECRTLLPRATTAICISQNVADQLDPARFQKLIVANQPTAAAVTREIAAAL